MSDNMLREKIAKVIDAESNDPQGHWSSWTQAADRILEIPEIADALRACEEGGELDVYRANCEWPD